MALPYYVYPIAPAHSLGYHKETTDPIALADGVVWHDLEYSQLEEATEMLANERRETVLWAFKLTDELYSLLVKNMTPTELIQLIVAKGGDYGFGESSEIEAPTRD